MMNKFCFAVPEIKDGEEKGRGWQGRGMMLDLQRFLLNVLRNKCNLLMDLSSLITSRLEFI